MFPDQIMKKFSIIGSFAVNFLFRIRFEPLPYSLTIGSFKACCSFFLNFFLSAYELDSDTFESLYKCHYQWTERDFAYN